MQSVVEVQRQKRPKLQKQDNPLTLSVLSFLSTLPPDAFSTPQANDDAGGDAARKVVAESAPKRWVIYEPMVLLPSGSFTSKPWTTLLGSFTTAQKNDLWSGILREISKKHGKPLTHLAANEGIPLHVASDISSAAAREENVLRSPSGLRMLFGDFGSDEVVGSEEDEASKCGKLQDAFWVSTKQNGIHQVWAPRWTMFSRGNVKEKARLLDFHSYRVAETQPPRERRVRSKADLQSRWAVDLYAGIGYFVFSYAKLGLRVLCWELNPWSVEGLRRGAEANRWTVRVVSGRELEKPTPDLVAGAEQIIVFLENNARAQSRIDELRRSDPRQETEVLHVNCGFLPSSIDTWLSARSIQGPTGDGWLHLHENAGVNDIEARRLEIQQTYDTWQKEAGDGRTACVEHVELVKTFAPGVWHCVFDVYITSLVTTV